MAQSTPPPRDPDPDHWLMPERLQRLQQELGPSVGLLRLAGLLNQVLAYWVRVELAAEMATSPSWPEQEREQEIDQREEAWLAKHDPASWGLGTAQLRKKLLVAPACDRWARQQWQHRLESLYLERKDQLDRASCRLLRIGEKHLALELFHRLRAGEDTFEQLSVAYGEGPERANGGLLPLQPLTKLPYGLAPVLRNLKPGELTPPQAFGKGFAMVQLEKFKPAPLDNAAREFLLAQELNAWILSVVERLQSHLILANSP
jgi:parvulin-like peptidyl-prolyl isomerase